MCSLYVRKASDGQTCEGTLNLKSLHHGVFTIFINIGYLQAKRELYSKEE